MTVQCCWVAVDDPVREVAVREVEVKGIAASAMAGGFVIVCCEVEVVGWAALESDRGEEVGKAGWCDV